MEKEKALTFVGVIIIILILGISFTLLFEYIKQEAEHLITTFGLLGIAIMVFIMDVIIQPFSPDVIVFGSSLLSDSLFSIAIIAGLSSVLAGFVGHLIGRKIGTIGFIQLFGKKHVNRGEKLFKKWGSLAIIVGALSPIPYSAICWLSGIYRMNKSLFVIFSLAARIPRFILFAYFGKLF